MISRGLIYLQTFVDKHSVNGLKSAPAAGVCAIVMLHLGLQLRTYYNNKKSLNKECKIGAESCCNTAHWTKQ